ncbi:MAG: hypothetical protein ACKN82_06895, partial [Pirellula sp.]
MVDELVAGRKRIVGIFDSSAFCASVGVDDANNPLAASNSLIDQSLRIPWMPTLKKYLSTDY